MSKKKTKRTQEILELNKRGVISSVIAEKYGITKQRVYQILTANGISRNKQIKDKNKKLRVDIEAAANSGLTPKQIRAGFEGIDIRRYYPEITQLGIDLRRERNNEIGKQYLSGATAKEIIIKSTPDSLLKPQQIRGSGTIYKINRKQGVRKHPKVGIRSQGGIFEDKKILQFIQNKKDKDNWSFRRIADRLNELGHTTITGKEYKTSNVTRIYHDYKEKKHKRLKY